MPAEVRERAFEPFFTTKEAGEGTGLGLATVHGVVTDAGGTVEIDSEVGGGTVVTIFLPAAATGDVARARGADAPGASARPAAPACSSSRTRTRSAARRAGSSRPTATASARRRARDEALARWEPVDVLVTDVVMPGMSGQQLAEHARERAPGLRVVFMSGPHRGRRSSATARARARSRSSRSPSRVTRCCAASRRRSRLVDARWTRPPLIGPSGA